MSTVDYDQLARHYERRYESERWLGVERALDEFVGSSPIGGVVEAGCGTGHWLRHLRSRGIWPVGLDRSVEMLRVGRELDRTIPLVHGQAESLPLRQASALRIFCINALHHFENVQAFLQGAKMVLRPGGQLMVVGLDPSRGVDSWCVYDYFPTTVGLDQARYPSTARVSDVLRRVGFAHVEVREVERMELAIPARQALAEGRLDKGVTSQLALLSADEYNAGIAQLRQDVREHEARGKKLILHTDVRLYGIWGVVQR